MKTYVAQHVDDDGVVSQWNGIPEEEMPDFLRSIHRHFQLSDEWLKQALSDFDEMRVNGPARADERARES